MTKKEIRNERKAIQELIRHSQTELYLQIKKTHPKMVRLIKKHYDAGKYQLTDVDYYDGIEHDLA
jgi:uncharacterized membrane protein YcgQ (UPF0703/DUF1980 family)